MINRIAVTLIALVACALAALAALSAYPGLWILAQPVRAMSPYCSKWAAVGDAGEKLARGDLGRAITAKSTVIKREGGLVLWQTPKGPFWIPDGNEQILGQLLAQQEHKIYGKGDAGVHKGDVVLDGGAHVGVYVMTALAAGAQLVVAIEPSPLALECLRRNFAQEIKQGKVIAYPKGLWDREETLPMFDNGNGAAGDSFVNSVPGATARPGIPVTTIDKMAAELNLQNVNFIKLDIKGATEKALHGGQAIITKHHPRFAISTEDPPEDPGSINRIVLGLNPAYVLSCGPCFYGDHEIRTDVMFYR